MSEGYLETILVEANQTTADTSNNTPATWCNTLSDIVHLKAGDKVSLYAGYISDKGAGNTKNIEVKGVSLKKTKSFLYTDLIQQTIDPFGSNLIVEETYELVRNEIELRDNEANIVLNYYKNTNGTGYIGLPRKYVDPSPLASDVGVSTFPFTQMEDASTGYLTPVANASYLIAGDYFTDNYSEVIKINNDNAKFTLFIAEHARFGIDDTQIGPISEPELQTPPVDNWTLAPEYKQFYQYRELHTLKIPSGFNSAQFISENLTRQLQQVISTRNIVFPKSSHNGSTADIDVSRYVESRTYKTFQTANINTLSEEQWENASANASTTYYNSFPTIAIKRPELYELGNYVNMNASVIGGETKTEFTRLLGSRLFQKFNNGSDEGMVTSIPYNASNLVYLRDFINAQANYPEVWDSFNASNRTYGNNIIQYDNTYVKVNNTRYFHLNTVSNASQIEIDDSTLTPSRTEVGLLAKGDFAIGVTEITVAWTDQDPNTKLDPAGYHKVLVTDSTDEANRAFENAEVLTWGFSLDAGEYVQTITFATPTIQTWNESLGATLTAIFYTEEDYNDYSYYRSSLGSSNYRLPISTPVATPEERISKLLLVYYNASDKDIYYDDPTPEQYSHGCFRYTNASFNGSTEKFVTIYPNKSDIVASLTTPTAYLSNGSIASYTKIGYDQHFTAPTTCAICLFNGKLTPINYYGEQAATQLRLVEFREQEIGGVANNYTNVSNTLASYFSIRYVGADNPELGWDGEHFYFDGLHTPENLGNRGANGGRYADPNDTPVGLYFKADANDDASSIVYKINPEEDINEYCPAIQPYQHQYAMFTVNGSVGAGTQYGQYFNRNYKAYNIFDSKSGIFIEDFGFTQETWSESLWGILGFSYEQFHSEINNRNTRVDQTNIDGLKYATTNAEVKPTDTKSWNTNGKAVPNFSDNIPCPWSYFLYNSSAAATGEYLTVFPSLAIKTTSLQLTADNYPTSMSRGYYNIRSDIIPTSSFIGGSATSTNMPIVGLVNKENPQNDFYFGGQSGVNFTITKNTMLSSISVSVHDPDGTYANIDDNSSIVFQIQRPITTSFNIADEILNDKKK